MEIRFPATEAPHYLQTLAFSREGKNICIQIVDHNNYEKARFEVEQDVFVKALDSLGIIGDRG